MGNWMIVPSNIVKKLGVNNAEAVRQNLEIAYTHIDSALKTLETSPTKDDKFTQDLADILVDIASAEDILAMLIKMATKGQE